MIHKDDGYAPVENVSDATEMVILCTVSRVVAFDRLPHLHVGDTRS
jgi:hypothetical protein